MVAETKGKVVLGGDYNSSECYMAPTLIQGAQLGEPLLEQEIFGPVLPVVAVDSMQDAVYKVNSICSDPLALYVYTEDESTAQMVLNNTTSGGGCINSCLEHLMNPNLPFGGVGASGYGSYHGKAGFDEFTHRRSILHQDTLLLKKSSLPQPPYSSGKEYDFAVKATITGFLTDAQKTLLKAGAAVGVALAALSLRSRL